MKKTPTTLLLILSLTGCKNPRTYTYKDLETTAKLSYQNAQKQEQQKTQILYETFKEAYDKLLLERKTDCTNLMNACNTLAESYEKQGQKKLAEDYRQKKEHYKREIIMIEQYFKGRKD